MDSCSCIALVFAALLLASVLWSTFWAWGDAQRRGQPGFPIALLVFLLFPAGLAIWLFLRPKLPPVQVRAPRPFEWRLEREEGGGGENVVLPRTFETRAEAEVEARRLVMETPTAVVWLLGPHGRRHQMMGREAAHSRSARSGWRVESRDLDNDRTVSVPGSFDTRAEAEMRARRLLIENPSVEVYVSDPSGNKYRVT